MAKTTARDQRSTSQDDSIKKRKKQAKKEAKLMLQIEQSKKDVAKAQQKITKAENGLQANIIHLKELQDQLTQLQNGGKISPRHAAKTATAATTVDNAPWQKTSKEATTTNTPEEQAPQESQISLGTDPGESYEDNPDVVEQHRAEQEPAEGRADIGEATPPEGRGEVTPVAEQPTKQEPPERSADAEEPLPTEIPIGQASVHSEIKLSEPETPGEAELAAANLANIPEEDRVITSGDGSIPLVTSDEHAWPPPETREEIAEGVSQTIQEDKTREETASSQESQATTGDENPPAEEQQNGKQTTPRKHTTRRRRTTTAGQNSENT